MDLFKKVIRKVSFSGSVCSIKEVLEGFIKRSDEEIEDFSGKLDELILAQAVRVLRKEKVCITPEAIDEFDHLTELVKSLKEVKENVNKDIPCRAAASPRK